MSITPLTPAENSQGGFRTWVKSQRKFAGLPGQLSAEINTPEVREAKPEPFNITKDVSGRSAFRRWRGPGVDDQFQPSAPPLRVEVADLGCIGDSANSTGAFFTEQDEAEVEHASAKQLIADIESMSTDDRLFDAKIKLPWGICHTPRREEENELFPEARESGVDLKYLGAELAKRKVELMKQSRTNPHCKNGPTLCRTRVREKHGGGAPCFNPSRRQESLFRCVE